ncbi:putative dehydrogenase [Abditibacterium utsteinense]|uniref:Putative dehydrogenase n=1 Tax=Abditibacterium utsteinense TaxID=1960156 RepID=A0A2S8SQY3_9BACT|nr:Gfo/Idh/MocA family oxidoreductase [Abditibacterium utsteinense]PQV63222.1 putative dehydrogenase [Abditibacterium utsteinense]
MNEKLKIALIGTGGWAREHGRILQGRADVDFCAVVGRNPERTAVRAAQYGTTPYTDIQAMLAAQKPDLVCVCLPNQHHFEATLQLLEAGVPLLVEKPLVFEMEQANALLEAAKKRDLFFAINFNHRYAKPLQLAKDAIEGGKLGEIIFATWRFGGEGSSDHPHANLIETQCHAFDQLEWLCGPIESIAAQMTDLTGQGFSTLALSLRFASGAVGSLLGTYDSSYAYRDTQRIEINGTKGRVLIEDTVRRFEFQSAGDEIAQTWQAGYFNDHDREFHRTFDRHMDAVLTAFRAGQKPPVGAWWGKRALQLALAAIESHETGRRVGVPQTREAHQ